MNELPGQHWPDREPATGELEGTGRSQLRRVPRHAAAPELGTDGPRHEPIPAQTSGRRQLPEYPDAAQAAARAPDHPPAGGAANPPTGNPAWSRARYLSRFPLWQAAAGVAVAALIASAIAMIAQGGTTTTTRPAATRAAAATAGSTSHPENVMQ